MLANNIGTPVPTSQGEMVVQSLTIQGLIALFSENAEVVSAMFSGEFDLERIVQTSPVLVTEAIKLSTHLDDAAIAQFDNKDRMVLLFSTVKATADALATGAQSAGKLAEMATRLVQSL